MTDLDAYLEYLAYQGAVDRYGVNPEVFEWDTGHEQHPCHHHPDENIRDRIDHELDVIRQAGFSGYFLIVADLLRWCRESGIATGPGRGSVCGSAVAYATGITDVDPIRWGIPFERFLHLERIAMPDVDLDVSQARRQEVLQYLRDKYGHDSVAQIITYGTLMAKGVVKDVCRILHVDEELRGIKHNETGEMLSKAIPDGSGADQVKLAEFMATPEGANFRSLIERLEVPYQGRTVSVLDTALRLEGINRHSSVHAAGVVIADRPLIELAPLYRKNKDAEVCIQYDMKDAEEIGLLKFDVLGLRTITVIEDAERLIRLRDPAFAIKLVSLEDEATYRLLARGDTYGVFQLEGEGITGAVTGVAPDRFEDIVAILALYRPGPIEQLPNYIHRKHGEEAVSVAHPDLGTVLASTYGLIVYQEQVMGIVRALGGYSAGAADMFRKAIGKKIPELIREEIDKFKAAALGRGYEQEMLDKLCEQIAYFGRYGFNLGHATGYAYITYWTAYLKANHPTEFFAALLDSHTDDAAKLAQDLREAKRAGISILPPDINRSGRGFTVESGGEVRFGLSAVKGLGENVVTDILEERDGHEKNQYTRPRVQLEKEDGTKYMANILVAERVPHTPRPFDGVEDFCRRLPSVNVGVKRSLAVAGAFGAEKEYRKKLHAVMDDLNKKVKAGKAFNLDLVEDWEPVSDLDLAKLEREAVGFYVTGHPLEIYSDLLDTYGAYVSDHTFAELPGRCTIAGMVTDIRVHQARNGEMAWVKLENGIEGMPKVTIFASSWEAIKDKVKNDAILVVSGDRDNHPTFGLGFKAESVRVVDRSRPSGSYVRVAIPPGGDSTDLALISGFLRGESGPHWLVAVVDESGRGAIVNTLRRGPITGATLSAFREMGWEVAIDDVSNEAIYIDGERWVKKDGQFAGRGASRAPIWEVPFVAETLNFFTGSKLVTEIKPCS